MIVVTMLEFGAVVLSLLLLRRELISRQSRNFLTAVFMLCYVPLYCLYPFLARLFVGGATSISRYQPGVIGDAESYLVFQAANYGVLAMIWVVGKRDDAPLQEPPQPPFYWGGAVDGLAILLCCGVGLSILGTGLSISELLVAVRFTWLHQKDYSPLLTVISSYLIALSPVLIYLCVMERQWRLLVFAVVLLVLHGFLFKDRKWLIFIGSGLLAAYFSGSGRRLPVNAKAAWLLASFGFMLWFWQAARNNLFLAATEAEINYLLLMPQVMADTLVRGDIPYYYNASVTAIHMHLEDGYGIPFGILRRQLFFFLPASFSFGLKIEDISALFSDAIGGGDVLRRGNMPPGFFGLFVLSFGWLGGVATLVLFPLVLRFLDRVARQADGWGQTVVICFAFSSTIYLLRGDDSSATYFPVFALAVTWGGAYFWSLSRRLMYRRSQGG